MTGIPGGSFQDIAHVHVASDAAGIRIVTAPAGSPVTVELLDRRGLPLADEHLELSQSGDRLDVRVRTVRDSRWRRGRVLDARLRIAAPLPVSVDVQADAGAVTIDGRDAPVTIATAAGAVHVDRVDGPLEVRTNAGAIKVVDSHGDATIRSDAGAIKVERMHGDRIELVTSAGAIDARELHVDHLRASTEVGAARLRFERVPTSVDSTCSIGTIEVALPRDGYRIATETGMFGRADIDGSMVDEASTRTVRVAATGMGAVKVVAAEPAATPA